MTRSNAGWKYKTCSTRPVKLFGRTILASRGGEACVRAISLATLDPWLREQAIDVALRAADSAVEKDWRSAETLVHGLTEVRADLRFPLPCGLALRERSGTSHSSGDNRKYAACKGEICWRAGSGQQKSVFFPR